MKLLKLALGGGLAFWVTSVVTSLLPIAAEYRAAYSNWSPQTVWVGSLFMGMIIGFCVTYFLLRFFDKIPTRNPITKSVILSLIALVIAIIVIDVPQSFFGSGHVVNPSYYFFIGVIFDLARFLILGAAIGYLYRKLREPARIYKKIIKGG